MDIECTDIHVMYMGPNVWAEVWAHCSYCLALPMLIDLLHMMMEGIINKGCDMAERAHFTMSLTASTLPVQPIVVTLSEAITLSKQTTL